MGTFLVLQQEQSKSTSDPGILTVAEGNLNSGQSGVIKNY